MTPAGVNTWNKIIDVYFNLPDISVPQFPGTSLRVGSRGNDVLVMQKYLNTISGKYTSIPTLVADGVFGSTTQAAVMAFQRQFSLTADGVIGRITWNRIVTAYNKIFMERTKNVYTTTGFGEDKNNFDKLAMMLLFRRFTRF